MRKKLIILAILAVVIAAVLAALAHVYIDYLWFEHLGFSSVFMTRLYAQIGFGVVAGVIALVLLLLHILLIRRFSQPREVWTFPTSTGEIIDLKDVVQRVSTPVVLAAAVLVATAMGYWASTHWEELLKVLNKSSFGESEPILNKDIGFYLFTLPVMEFIQEWLVYLTGICLVFSAGVYFLRNAIVSQGRHLEMTDQVRGHLLFALASVMLALAWGWRLEMFELLFSKRGVAYGATFTDVWVNFNVYRVMIVASILAAVALIVFIFTKPQGSKGTLYPVIALGTVVGLYLLGTFVAPTLVQQIVVNPNELEKERPYLKNAIAGTRRAYNLDKIDSREFSATEDLTVADLQQNKPTIDNIKIWDHRPLRATYRQVQVIRLYYDFPSITVDRYRANDNYYQVMLSPRELLIEQLPGQSQTWVNTHLQYTHGYGVVLSPVKHVVGEGLPDLWVKDIPPESRYPNMKVDQPGIYYGQSTSAYALVRTTMEEFDYPKGKENKYTTYDGEGGIGIGSFFRRLLFAIRFTDKDLLFTSTLTDESKILFNRLVQERVNTVAPFLRLDQEPYLVINDGRLFWVQDAYTISYRYPYSQPTPLGRGQRINYMRNSVKVVVDAYHGKMSFYVADPSDPMIQTYTKIFPALFKPFEAMPAGLKPHMRYPKDLFAVQATMYESFHMTDPQVFYNQEDKWAISHELGEKTIGRQQEQAERGTSGISRQMAGTSLMEPYYMIMRLPQEKQEEFLLMLPFTPTNKHNMVAWMTARCDGENYGKLIVYTFPKQKLVFGPMQIEARINQDEHISQWITLRNQHGSTVIRGDLLVIPIKDSILYVEPIYLQSTQTQLPELKQIIVAFGKRLTMKGTLQEALQEVFNIGEEAAQRLAGEEDGKPEGAPVQPRAPAQVTELKESTRQLLERAVEHYNAGQDKVSQGDWAGFGQEQQALKEALDKLAGELELKLQPTPPQQPKPAPNLNPTPNPSTAPSPTP